MGKVGGSPVRPPGGGGGLFGCMVGWLVHFIDLIAIATKIYDVDDGF